MASWKKLIVSGSDAVLSTVTVDTVVCGNLCGNAATADDSTNAGNVNITNYNGCAARYLTFTSNSQGCCPLQVDSSTLAYIPGQNRLCIGGDGITDQPGQITLVNSGSIGPVSSTIQAPTGTSGDTIACLPLGSGVIVVDKLNNTFSGANTFTGVTDFTSTVCLGNATSDIIQATGSVSISGSLAVDGPIVGQITNATCVCVGNKSDNTNYFPTFVDSSGSAEILYVDSGNNLIYNPSTNLLQAANLKGTTSVCGGNVVGTVLCSQGTISGSSLYVSGVANVGGNAIIQGDLTVNGTTTYLNTANLAVEDRFVLLNSGSNTPREAGLVVDEGVPSGSGHAFVYDSNTARWGFTSSLDSTATSVAPDAFTAAVVASDISEYRKDGNIRVEGGEIYIYVT